MGEGCFDVRISPASNMEKYRINLRIRFTQHVKDLRLIENIRKLFGCGKFYRYKGKSTVSLAIFYRYF